MLTIGDEIFTDEQVKEINADLERWEKETGRDNPEPLDLGPIAVYRQEKAKRHETAMAEAKAEFDQWDKNRDPKAWMKPKARLFDTNALRGE